VRWRGQPEELLLTIPSSTGDALEMATVKRALTGVDVVIQSLGVSAGPEIVLKPTRLFSKATRVLVTAMEQAHVKRLISVTGFGAGDSRGHGGFLYSLGFHLLLLLGPVYDDKDVQERIVRRSKLRPASIGLPKNGDDGRVGEARRITFAVINVTDNVRGELSAHVITVSELNRQKIARAIECDGYDAESVGIIDTTDVVRRDHFALPHGREGHFQPSSENKKRAISHPQMLSTINATNPIPTSSTASATESYSSQCR